MRVLVCGGRNYDNREHVFQTLESLSPPVTRLIVGDARGADELAYIWACRRDRKPERYRAEWDMHGLRAGPIRNQRMIDEGKPDLVVAFPGGRGTADMVRRAKAAGVPVREIQ